MLKNLKNLTDDELRVLFQRYQAAKRAAEDGVNFLKLENYKPYPKQALFHELGASYLERLFSAANQSGKTYAGAAETTYHLTGLYPPTWKGRVFTRPVSWVVGSETGELTRDGAQRLLLGPPSIRAQWGTGLIPRECIAGEPKLKKGANDAVDTIVVKHKQGGHSTVNFKSYDQGRTRWQANTLDGVWLDEEPPYDVYEEARTRTNATNGIMYITSTPLKGMSKVVYTFFKEPGNDRIVVMMSIDEAGHYTEEMKERIIAGYDEATRDARVRGIPVLGSGRVFPISDSQIKIDPIEIPAHWARVAALDFGWDHPTAAVAIAWDRDTDTMYLYDEYRVREKTPEVHAAALRKWGENLPWMWPQDGYQHSKDSGIQISSQYRSSGLDMHYSHVTFDDGSNGVEAGIMEMLTRMQEGRFKVFSTCELWLSEFGLYHRKDGLIVKQMDDLLDASRYAMMGKRFARTLHKRRRNRNFSNKVLCAVGTGAVVW